MMENSRTLKAGDSIAHCEDTNRQRKSTDGKLGLNNRDNFPVSNERFGDQLINK